MSTQDVVNRLLKCVEGQIVACNIIAGVENDLITKCLVREAFEWLARLATHRPAYGAPHKTVQLLRKIRDGQYPKGFAASQPKPEFRLRARLNESDFSLNGSVSCVLPAFLLNSFLSPEDKDRFYYQGLTFPAKQSAILAPATVDAWQQKPARERQATFDPEQSLGRSVLWFTRTAALQTYLEERGDENSAQNARDVLGLVHYGRGVVMAALHFSEGAFRSRETARPTFVDAADHTRFKTWPDSVDAQEQPHWGFTTDLHALESKGDSVDGCPERVVREIDGQDLRKHGRFEFEVLGAVTQPRGQSEDDDNLFATRLRGGLSVADLKRKLVCYVAV